MKYVFHIPLYKYADGDLIEIEIDSLINELVKNIQEFGICSFYTTNVKSYYKSRSYDELLITIFDSSNGHIENIFIDWFKKNNHLLQQKELAYEQDNELIIKSL